MKIVKVKPFGVFQITEDVVKTVENNTHPEVNSKKNLKTIIKDITRKKSGHFVAIDPVNRKLFSFIPIIKNQQFFAANFPDPVQLYYSLAYANFQFANQTRDNITAQVNPNNNGINFVNGYLYNWHLQYKISTIIFLHSTMEAFINYIMPDEFIYRQEYDDKSGKFLKQIKEYNKEQTERYIIFKEKMSNVIPQLTSVDFQKTHKQVYDLILNLNTYRNDLIHLRSTKTQNQQEFEKVFDKIVNINLEPFVNAVKDFINILKPDFIEFEETTPAKENTAVFNFQDYNAFNLDLTIFLKILEVPEKKVILIIAKSNDDNYKNLSTWVMRNLDVMAKQQLIYFPDMSASTDDKLIIEITKTSKKLGVNPKKRTKNK